MNVRIPRPIRDLGRAHGLNAAAAARALLAASDVEEGGDWGEVDLGAALGTPQDRRRENLRLRLRDGNLDAWLLFRRCEAIATGRRLIVVLDPIPDTIQAALPGRPLSVLTDAPYLQDPLITIQRVIGRAGAGRVDVRCRMPNQIVELGTGSD